VQLPEFILAVRIFWEGKVRMLKFLLSVAAVLSLAFPAHAKDPKLGGGFERYASEHEFVLGVIAELNVLSVQVNLEYCGFIYYDSSGQLRATRPEKGGSHSCLPIRPTGNARVFSSYHTHAAYDPNSLNEYPSEQDMEGDFGNRQHGYIATPGGRLWFVDYQKQVARQLCGYRCLAFDPRYRENRRNRPVYSVTLPQLSQIVAREFGE